MGVEEEKAYEHVLAFAKVAGLEQGENGDGKQTLRAARNEGLEGLVAKLLLDSGEEPVQAEAKQAFVRNFCQSAGYQSKFQELEFEFQARGLSGIVLKGMALTLTLYKETVGVRELSDIDLMLKEEELPQVRQLLEDLGYGMRFDTDMGYLRDGYHIDLHTRFFDRVDKAYCFDTDLAWATQKSLGDEYVAMGCLEDHFRFCYLAAHGMDHGFSRLKWLLDLGMLAHKCDGEKLKDMAIKTYSLKTVVVSLASCKVLFGTEFPEGFDVLVGKLGKFERLFVNGIADRSLPKEAGKFMALWNAKGIGAKASILKNLLSVRGESTSARMTRFLQAVKGLG